MNTYLALSLLSWSICSPISATASLCFLRRLARVLSCWMLASSRSRLNLLISASLFLLSSIWAEVAPPASSRRSPSSSSSRARSARCFSACKLNQKIKLLTEHIQFSQSSISNLQGNVLREPHATQIPYKGILRFYIKKY